MSVLATTTAPPPATMHRAEACKVAPPGGVAVGDYPLYEEKIIPRLLPNKPAFLP